MMVVMTLTDDVNALPASPAIGQDFHVDNHGVLDRMAKDYITRMAAAESALSGKASAQSVTDLQNTAVTTGSAASLASLVVTKFVKNAAYTTALRPSAVTLGVGAQIYDTTLSLMVFSDGAVWRNALGATA